jgi:hypothetical protein
MHGDDVNSEFVIVHRIFHLCPSSSVFPPPAGTLLRRIQMFTVAAKPIATTQGNQPNSTLRYQRAAPYIPAKMSNAPIRSALVLTINTSLFTTHLAFPAT